jgi:hypothetical protein
MTNKHVWSRKGAFAQKVVYHGRWENTETGKKFGGKHYGTKKAAKDRLASIFNSKTNMLGPVGAKRSLGKPVIKQYIFDDERVFAKDEPIDEGIMTKGRSGDTRDSLAVIQNLPQFRDKLKMKGYKGVAYINAVEDKGSTSYLVWDKDLVKEVKMPIPIEIILGNAKSLGRKMKGKVADIGYKVYKLKQKAGKMR